MNILHVSLASAVTEYMLYQENLLSEQNKLDGHKVTVISDCHKFLNGKMVDTMPEDRIMENGVRLIRLKYMSILTKQISSKVKKTIGLEDILQRLQPDVILFHGLSSVELVTVAKYIKKHPNVKLYVDNHADFYNSAHGFMSREILHKLFYKWLIQKSLSQVEKVFYISLESKEFLKLYKIPEDKMEFFPLGGKIIDGDEYRIIRNEKRNELNISKDKMLFVHTGKLDELKRTKDLLEAFQRIKSKQFTLVIIGVIHDDIKETILSFINRDDRIQFLGWKNSDELIDYLCAADMYLQPGSQSATMQNAISCGCPVMLYPYKSHEPYLIENGFYVKTVEDMVNVFKTIDINPKILKVMSKASYDIAYGLLDYRKLADRLYQ